MRAQRHEPVRISFSISGTNAKHIAHLIHLHIGQPDLAEAVGQPGAADRFSKRRRGNPSCFHLPAHKLRFLRTKTVESRAHNWRGGESRDFLLYGGIRIGSCRLWNRVHSLRLSYNAECGSGAAAASLPVLEPFAPGFDRLARILVGFIPHQPAGGIIMKKIVKIAAIVVGVLIIAAIAIPLLVNVNSFRPEIESNLSAALGRPVKVGNLSLSILSGSVEADQMSIADDPKFSNTPFIQAKTLKVGVELLPLVFSKQLNVTKIVIDHPEINLLRNREGVWNFSSLGNQSAQPAQAAGKSSSAPANISVAKLELTDGTITLGSTTVKRKPISYDKVNVDVRNFSFTNAFPLVVSAGLPGGGSLKIDGNAGPINSTDTSLTPVQAKVTLKKLDLSQSALVDPELGINGSADFDGTLASDGHIAKANGTLKATSLKLVPKGSPAGVPVNLVFAVEHDLKSESGKLMQGDIAIGKAVAKLTGTYNMH